MSGQLDHVFCGMLNAHVLAQCTMSNKPNIEGPIGLNLSANWTREPLQKKKVKSGLTNNVQPSLLHSAEYSV